MACSNAESLSACSFPSIASDEESFVVLWKEVGRKSIVETGDSISTGVEEPKELINKELAEIEQLSLPNKTRGQTEINQSADKLSDQNPKVAENIQMDPSLDLTKIPQVARRFDSADIITNLYAGLTSEQVQMKISEIIEENIQLKDKILQNNITMKLQYEKIVAWQKDVEKVHQAHKEKIIEAKEYIEKLKKENYNLNREQEQMKASKIAREDEITSLKQELRKSNVQLQDAKVGKSEFIDIRVKIGKYKADIENLRRALRVSKIEIDEVKMELAKEKSVNEEKQMSLNEIIDTLRSQLTMQPSVEEVADIQQQLASSHVKLAQVEHSRNSALAEIENLNKEVLKFKSPQTQVDEMYALTAQMDMYKAAFEEERSAKEIFKTKNEKLVEDMQNLQKHNQQLQEKMNRIHTDECVVA